MDERELEETLRAGLAVHAQGADTTAPVVERVRADVGRRRRTRWSAVAAAAAVAAIVGGTSLVALDGDDPERSVDAPPVADSQGAVDGAWRTEYWADVAVDVPADWGYGGAPDGTGTACYPEAMVGPDGERVDGGRGLGYVGRPITATDVCALVPQAWEPSAPYVWLGAGIEPGVHDYGNGYVQETLVLAGTTITVGSEDASVRSRILGSAREAQPAHDPCATTSPHIPRPRFDLTDEGLGDLLHAEVCAYHRDDGGDYWLSYAQALESSAVERTFRAVAAAPRSEVDCDYTPFEFVVVRALYDDPFGGAELERSVVIESGCDGSMAIAGEPARRLTPEAVEPWARNGIPAVVSGPTGGKGAMIDSFIGPQG